MQGRDCSPSKRVSLRCITQDAADDDNSGSLDFDESVSLHTQVTFTFKLFGERSLESILKHVSA